MVLLDNRKVSTHVVHFACHMARLSHSNLTGIFLEAEVEKEELTVVQAEAGDIVVESVLIRNTKANNRRAEEIRQQFFEVTERNGVQASFQTIGELPAATIKNKSRFADALVLDAALSIEDPGSELPSRFVKTILQEAECAVVLAPENVQLIDNIVFVYNGMRSSVLAMKQFLHLFPGFKNKRVKVIDIGAEKDPFPESRKELADWLNCHFADVEVEPLDNAASKAFFHFLLKKRNDIVVMGSYGSGLLETFFEKDRVGDIHPTSIPLFIAH